MASRQRRFAGPHAREERDDPGPLRREMIYLLGALSLFAFGAFVWNFFGAPEAPRIVPPTPYYKIAPQAQAPDAAESSAVDDVMSGAPAADGPVAVRPGPEAPIAETPQAPAPGARPELTAAPQFAANGPYVAQVAALRSQPAVEQAWARLASRAPDLFAEAHLDVQRADLGQRGVYYRVRAGYFADATQVARFCDRIRAMGQDCIAVRR